MSYWDSFRSVLAEVFHVLSRVCSDIEGVVRPVTYQEKPKKEKGFVIDKEDIVAQPETKKRNEQFNLSIIKKLFKDNEIEISQTAAFNMLLKKIERITFKQLLQKINGIITPDDLYTFLKTLTKPDWKLPYISADSSGPFLGEAEINEYFTMEQLEIPKTSLENKVEFLINRSYAKAYILLDEQFGQLFEQFENSYNNSIDDTYKVFSEIKHVASILTPSR